MVKSSIVSNNRIFVCKLMCSFTLSLNNQLNVIIIITMFVCFLPNVFFCSPSNQRPNTLQFYSSSQQTNKNMSIYLCVYYFKKLLSSSVVVQDISPKNNHLVVNGVQLNGQQIRFWSLRSEFKSRLVCCLKLNIEFSQIIQACGTLANTVTLYQGAPLQVVITSHLSCSIDGLHQYVENQVSF